MSSIQIYSMIIIISCIGMLLINISIIKQLFKSIKKEEHIYNKIFKVFGIIIISMVSIILCIIISNCFIF